MCRPTRYTDMVVFPTKCGIDAGVVVYLASLYDMLWECCSVTIDTLIDTLTSYTGVNA